MNRTLGNIVTLAAPILALSVPTGQLSAGQAPKVEFEKLVLKNGLQVILHVDRKLPIVHVNQWFHVGSKNEEERRTGFAHLFEHLMFQGSKNAPGEYFAFVEKVGANLMEGGVNGTTDFDRTNYFVTAPAGSLEYLLWLESDRLTSLMEAVDQAALDNQREVVRNERRQSLENVPYGRAFQLMFENLFPEGHPYSWLVIGSHEDLEAATLEDVKKFFETYYTPNNLTLTIAGDFDPEAAKKMISKYFGSIPPGPALARPALMPVTLPMSKQVVVADRVPQPRTYMVWPGVSYFQAGEAELDLAAAILASGLSSRLQRSLIYEKQICSSVQAYAFSLESAGLFNIVATARPGASLEEVEALVDEQLYNLALNGPTKEELNRAKNKYEFGFITGLERIGGFGGKADQLARYNTFLGDPDLFADDLARYQEATPESVQLVVQKYLEGKNRLVVRFVPETSQRPDVEEPDRTQVPAIAEGGTFQVPQIQSATLENGLQLFVVESHELPKVAVQLALRSGTSSESVERAGESGMTLRMMDKGTGARSALEIEQGFSDLGTQLGRMAKQERSALSFQVLKKNLEPAMELFADVALNPSFPAEELERERKKALDDLLQSRKDARRISSRIIPMLLFGRDHPYGHDTLGNEETLGKLTPLDLKAVHARTFRPGNAALIFAGDTTLEEAKALAVEHFAGWKGEAAPRQKIPAASRADTRKVYLVDRQDAAQTQVAFAMPGITRDSEDYYSLTIADAVLGGGFGTRLNKNLREDKGYSYGAFSFPVPLSQAGWWQAGGGVQTKVTKESIVEFRKELKRLVGKTPITQKELDDAKDNRIRGYSQGFESLGKVAAKVAFLWAYDRPMSELKEEPEALAAVTLDQANQAARKYVDLDQTLLLLVGDRKVIEEGVRSLDIGDVVILDASGNPVP